MNETELARLPPGILASTTSLCAECLAPVPAQISATSRGVVLRKLCPSHGGAETLIADDPEWYLATRAVPRRVKRPQSHAGTIDRGCPEDCGLCPGHEQHTCLAIVEITSRCDLTCPVCLAAAEPEGEDWNVAVFARALRALLRCEGAAVPLQISGGEPTLHPDLAAMVRCARDLGFRKIEVDSNGLALARDLGLSEKLRDAGLSGVYLQMDGLTPEISVALRGRDLIEDKVRAMENARVAGLDVVLAVTVVPGVNDDRLWEMIRFGVTERLTGVNFQPIAQTGRFPASAGNPRERFAVGHFVRMLERQSNGQLQPGDVQPIPCSDPLCGAMTYALVHRGTLVPGQRLIPRERLDDFAAVGADWCQVIGEIDFAQATGCGCSTARPTASDPSASRPAADIDFFAVGFHGMMDAHSFDSSRAQRCCVHELTREGKLIPFCLYNIKYRHDGQGNRIWRAR